MTPNHEYVETLIPNINLISFIVKLHPVVHFLLEFSPKLMRRFSVRFEHFGSWHKQIWVKKKIVIDKDIKLSLMSVSVHEI